MGAMGAKGAMGAWEETKVGVRPVLPKTQGGKGDMGRKPSNMAPMR
jgi:hypothetical protein